MTKLHSRYQRPQRLKIVGMVMGLFSLIFIAIGFVISIVQVQAAIAGYTGGESI